MAAGDSIISICNLGLLALGQDPVNSLTDNRKAAILCNARYEQVRREMLRAHPWGFARRRAQLPASDTQPAFGDFTAFTLPSDFIRLVEAPDVCKRRGWMIEQRQLLSNETAPLNLLYIFDCQDATLFDPLFIAVLGYAIAVELAIPITQDRGIKSQMETELEGKLASARLVTSQDNSSSEYDVDVLLESRN
jgi:hypothetical protein